MKYLFLCIAFAFGWIIGNADAALPAPGTPGAPDDPRYCGEPERNADGTIKRSATQRWRFVSTWPKPADGRVWYVDHVIPRANGGCDAPHNMQWLPAELKTCVVICKDRWERKVYVTREAP